MNLFTKNGDDDTGPMNHVKRMIKEITGVEPESVNGLNLPFSNPSSRDNVPAMKGFLDKGSILDTNKSFFEEYLQKERELIFLEWTKEIARHLGSGKQAVILHKGLELGKHLGSRDMMEQAATKFVSSLEEELMSKGWVVERRFSRVCVDPDNRITFIFLLVYIE